MKPQTTQCLHCSAPITQHQKGRVRLYCASAHKKLHYNLLERQAKQREWLESEHAYRSSFGILSRQTHIVDLVGLA
ncbi:hypothetical protein JCM14076_16000 [Methylosoma difficile]